MTTNVKLMVVLQKLNYAFMYKLGKNLQELGMPASEYPIMAHLYEVGRAKTQDLGKRAFITSGSITHTVNKLIEQGFVIKIQDEKDKRIFWVEITEVGRKQFECIDEKHQVFLSYLLEDFQEEEKLDLIEQLKYFGKNIEQKKEGNL